MFRTPVYIATTIVTLGAVAVLLFGHAQSLTAFINLSILQAILFVHLLLKVTAALAFRPHKIREGFDMASIAADVVIPIYNEDPPLLAAGLRALRAQTRLPRAVWLIDDGSQADGVPVDVLNDPIVYAAIAELRSAGVIIETRRQANRGKRWAQSVAFEASDADVFITIDSDTCLDPRAVEKLLVPFSTPEVHSVAGFPMGQNYRKSLLTRAIDLGFTMSSIQGRMAEGFFGQVRVNCGIIAAYRATTVKANLDRYLNQRFLGAPVKAGDDRALTYFAKEQGRAEFQPEAIAYSALPETLGHLARQRLRWARSWCWGTLLLLRRPVTSPDFWFTMTQLLGILGFGLVVFIAAFGVVTGAAPFTALVSTLAFALAIGAVIHLRYIVVAHPGDPVFQRAVSWFVSPFGSLIYIGLLLPLYYVAILRPRPKRGWGTRSKVEVGLHIQA
jgi:cellulose synthase/poly-beta-1,6-N-acetylglucosamine synthase-like glycosyltransferase